MANNVFANVLRKLRTERKLSQEKLAELSNLDPVTIYRYENEIQEPSLSNLFQLSKGLGINASEFVDILSKSGYSS